jgi:stage IV sporulation protein FB
MVLRFRLASIPVEVEPAFWVATLLLASGRLARPHLLVTWVAVVFASVLVHEMGHALVLRKLGYRPSIALTMMGGQAQAAVTSSLTWLAEVLVAIAGPLAGLTIGIPLLLLSLIPGLVDVPVLGDVLSDLVWVNLGWSLLNLMPVFPLDGGQVTRALLRRSTTPSPTRRTHEISIGVGALAAVIAALIGERFIAAGFGALAAYNVVLLRRGI